ncbi:hypothetical protein AMK15_24305 [Streptomyces sp. MJM1172]|nr:hypothetical protein AMK15_24305 [Streptomyces sp. MJM1172]
MLSAEVCEGVVEREQGGAQFFFLVVGEVTCVDAAHGLALDELAQQFDEGEDELEEVLAHGFWVG